MLMNELKPLVLIVDDHMPAVGMLSRLLEKEGYDIASAYDGEQALEVCQKLTPDLILLDIMMPKLNGFEVLQILRKTDKTANVPTILITAKNTPDDIEHGLELGADDYIAKPFNPRELLARAKSKIDARRLKDELESRTQDLEALLRVSEELKHHLNVNQLMELILYLNLDLLPGECAIIYQLDEAGNIVHNQMSYKDGRLAQANISVGLIADFINSDHISGYWQDDSIHKDYSYIMLSKMEYGQQIHGVMCLLNVDPYTANNLRLFEGISRQATLAMRNAELYEIKVNYADHLEEMVEERTEELKSAQQLLIRSEKLASVGRLSAGIAHEINNPLFPLRINLEGMIEDIDENLAIRRSDVEETLKSVERISRIVSRLLEFTGKDNSNQPDIEPVDVNSVIQSVLSLSQKYFEHAHVNIHLNLPALPPIFGNRDQLEQVFLNIMINAKAAMPDGGDLTIHGEQKKNNVVLKFVDTGTGIPEDLINKIFEPFVSTKEDGTGLGLFISYGIIENHQGSIDVESVVGSGTTFIIQLPIIQS